MKSVYAAAAMKRERWSERLPELLRPEAARRVEAMTEAELERYLERHLTCPTDFTVDMCGEILEAYFAASWAKTFDLLGLPRDLRVLEIASGDAAPVPFGVDFMSGGQGSYVTANLNRELTANFLRKVRPLGIDVRVIEDDAANAGRYFPPETFDAVAFQHAINDVLQTIIAEREGLDTVHTDWWTILPEMTRMTAVYYAEDKLRSACFDGFIGLIGGCAALTKPGGFLLFNNTVFQYDLDIGHPLELYTSYVPLARRWIAESHLKLTEVTPEEYDRQWWMILQKD